MACPFLDYRESDETHEFDHERPYCVASGAFVSPMRADICNDRHEFDHTTDCDIFREAFDADTAAPEPTD